MEYFVEACNESISWWRLSTHSDSDMFREYQVFYPNILAPSWTEDTNKVMLF